MNKELLIKAIEQGLSTWKLAEKFNTTQSNIRYWLKKFDLQTVRKTCEIEDTKLCPRCKDIKSSDEFYNYKKRSSFCKSCIVESNKERQRAFKQQAVDYKGGKCYKCGYNKCLAALDFHHTNPEEKDPKWNNYKRKFTDKMKKELDKCVLLCSNCHREEHNLS